MSERSFNRDQNDMEPVKFKPLYLIVGICTVAIIILACVIYIYLSQKEEASNLSNDSNTSSEVSDEIEYEIPSESCSKSITTSEYSKQVYTDCKVNNIVLNFTDVDMIIDLNKIDNNFTINGIYYNKKGVSLDDYLGSNTFKDMNIKVNNGDVQFAFTDALVEKKMGLYIYRNGNLLYSNGSSTNTIYTLGNEIKYSKYTTEGITASSDCNLVTDKTPVAYETGKVKLDGENYTEIFEKNVLVSEICK
jgi:hypothetical protein